MNQTILKIISDSVKEIGEDFEIPDLTNPTSDTPLYGKDGSLNSLALVRLIADVEQKLSDHYAKQVILADDKAMSQKRTPFRTIGSLSDYAEKLVNGEI